MERKLATIRRVAEVKEIPGADTIEAVRVDGWWVVAKKGEFLVDSLAVYLEIDSWVPNSIAPFLTKAGHEPKEFEGVKGERLRTVKLRGFTSQGLLLPFTQTLAEYAKDYDADDCVCWVAPEDFFYEGDDVTEVLGILKWERPLPASLAGMAKGNFPSFIPKTDQPRIQNCTRNFEKWVEAGTVWEISEKLDGSSMTVYVNHNEFDEEGAPKHGVCSRNLDLKRDEANSFWEAAIKYDLLEKIKRTGRSLAVQGELVGEGIQGNSYKLSPRQFFCFDIWDIDQQRYLLPEERRELCIRAGIQHVPVISTNALLKNIQDGTIASVLNFAEGKSVIGAKPEREGLVFKSCTEHDISFKAISNKFLLKGGE